MLSTKAVVVCEGFSESFFEGLNCPSNPPRPTTARQARNDAKRERWGRWCCIRQSGSDRLKSLGYDSVSIQ